MKNHNYRHLTLSILLVLLFFLAGCRFSDSAHLKVTKVIDGDTVELSNGQLLRYIGIDCPELRRKTSSGWRQVHEPFSEEAKRFNEELVLGKSVRLEFDIQKEDKYKRLLAYCFVKQDDNEIFVQAELLTKGLAYLYTFPPNIKYVDILVASLQEAKHNRAGVWSINLEIDSKEARRFIGQRKIVEGLIKRTRSGGRTIKLTMDGLVIVIFKDELDIFQKEGIQPARFYKGKKVRVFGLIKEYRGQPEIIVSNPWQIEVLE